MLEIFQFDFMVRAFVGGIIIAVICPLIGTFLVVRRYSLMADTLAHVSLSGVALGMLIGVDPVLTALIVSITSAFGVERLRIKGKIYGESALGLFLWGGLSLSVILISFAHGFNMKLFSFLFGSITTVSESDLHLMYIIGFISIAFVFLFYKELFAISFDEEVAKVSGINANLFNSSLVVIAAMVVSLSMRIVGILLVGALMVIPVITATQLSHSFRETLLFSVIISILSVVSGLVISYYLDTATGGTIVLLALFMFLLSLFINKMRYS